MINDDLPQNLWSLNVLWNPHLTQPITTGDINQPGCKMGNAPRWYIQYRLSMSSMTAYRSDETLAVPFSVSTQFLNSQWMRCCAGAGKAGGMVTARGKSTAASVNQCPWMWWGRVAFLYPAALCPTFVHPYFMWFGIYCKWQTTLTHLLTQHNATPPNASFRRGIDPFQR